MLPLVGRSKRLMQRTQRGLSRTGEADDAEDLAVSDLEGDVLNGMDPIAGISKGLADMFQLDHNILLSLLRK